MLQSNGNGRVPHQLAWWRVLPVWLAIAALSISVATRFCHDSSIARTSVQGNASIGMRQYMDRDATHWVAPVARLIFLQAVAFYPRFAPAGPPLPTVLFDESRYNRPPPFLHNLA